MEKTSKADVLINKASSSQSDQSSEWTRYTIHIRKDHLKTLKAAAFWSRIPVKSLLEKLLNKFFSSKKIRPIPTAEDEAMDDLFDETNTE